MEIIIFFASIQVENVNKTSKIIMKKIYSVTMKLFEVRRRSIRRVEVNRFSFFTFLKRDGGLR